MGSSEHKYNREPKSLSSNDQKNDSQISNKRVRDSPSNSNNTTKQLTLNDYWLSKPQSINRFSIPDVEEDKIILATILLQNHNLILNHHRFIFSVAKVESMQSLGDLLEQIIPSLYIIKVLRSDEIKIQPNNIDIYRIVTKALQEKNTEFHTFRPKQELYVIVMLFLKALMDLHH